MKKEKLKLTFIDPNPPEVTVRALQKIIVEKILQRLETDCDTSDTKINADD